MIEIYPLVRGLRIKANLLKIHKIGPQYLYTQGLNHNLYILYYYFTIVPLPFSERYEFFGWFHRILQSRLQGGVHFAMKEVHQV